VQAFMRMGSRFRASTLRYCAPRAGRNVSVSCQRPSAIVRNNRLNDMARIRCDADYVCCIIHLVYPETKIR
jgi:hypothetical protein